jgi:3'(2'), 5'-bisphosphate nucleotidase
MTDEELAAHLAAEAGRILLEVRASRRHHGAALGRAADAEANTLITAALRELRPGDGLLSEEENDDRTRLQRDRVWIVDPLDGTREYSEGRDDWAVHVGLAIGGDPRLGAVALPARGLVLRSDEPFNRSPSPPRPRMVVSRTRPPREADMVAEALGAELVPMGSAGAKAMAVVLGEAEIYLHAGGQQEWDSCAPVAVALKQGLHCSRLSGAPLTYNQPDPSMPDLIICVPELARPVLEMLR